MIARKPALIAVDGVAGASVVTAAKIVLALIERAKRSGISHWDASGVFDELAVAEEEAGRPSVRTLLLLYAADLAFRLRWEIRPVMAEGRSVVAAPYVDTAMAFGRAAGLSNKWLTNLFLFAPRPTERRFVDGAPARSNRGSGFVEFGWERVGGAANGVTRTDLVDRTAAYLRAAARRHGQSMMKV